MFKSRLVFHISGLIVFSFANIFSQTSANSKGFIIGQINERTTGQTIAGAKISVKNKLETTSDADGNFRLEIESGVYDVEISASGYAPIIKNQIGVTGNRNTLLNVRLDITVNESVEVRSEIFAENVEQTVSNITLNREEIRQTPGSGGDPLRVINSLPAVSAASGEFADLIVRGSSAEENLTFIDNISVQDFTYFTDKYDGNRGGRASILAPDILETAEFSAFATAINCRPRSIFPCVKPTANEFKRSFSPIRERRTEKRFDFKRWSVAPYLDYFNVTNHDSTAQPNYEFYQQTPQFLSENQRLPIFGLRLEF